MDRLDERISRIVQLIQQEIYDKLPRKVGIIAVNHFKKNFLRGGFVDGGLHAWTKTRRQEGNGTDAGYGPLTSRRNHLMRSIQSYPGRGEVTITNPVDYAAIHNEGGTIVTNPTVTPRMRRWAWRKCYSIAGIRAGGKLPRELPEDAAKYRALALTKKNRLHITAKIPKRQFIGDSKELQEKIDKMITNSINDVIIWKQ